MQRNQFLARTLADPNVIDAIQTRADDNSISRQNESQGVALLWRHEFPAHFRA